MNTFKTITKINAVSGGLLCGGFMGYNSFINQKVHNSTMGKQELSCKNDVFSTKLINNIQTIGMFYQGVLAGAVLGTFWFVSVPAIIYYRKPIRNVLCI